MTGQRPSVDRRGPTTKRKPTGRASERRVEQPRVKAIGARLPARAAMLLQPIAVRWALHGTKELMSHAVIAQGHASRAVTQPRVELAPAAGRAEPGAHRLHRHAEHARYKAHINVCRRDADAVVGVHRRAGQVADQHVAWKPVHARELPQDRHDRLEGLDASPIEDVAKAWAECRLVKRQDRE